MRRRNLVLTGFLLQAGLSVPASAQSVPAGSAEVTRTEELKRLRLARRAESTPPKKKRLEGYFKSFDRRGNHSLAQSNFWGFHPRVDWIARGSGIAGGVRYWNPEVWGPVDLMGSAFYSVFRYQHYALHLGDIPNRGRRMPSQSFERQEVDQLGDVDRSHLSKFKLYGTFRYRDRTDEQFFGLGPDSKKDDETSFRIKDTLLDAVTGYQFSQHIGYTFKAGVVDHALRRGRGQDSGIVGVPGTDDPPDYFRIQNSVLIDYRDLPNDPRRGFMAAASLENFRRTSGERNSNFLRWGLDVRGFFPLWSSQRVLALRTVIVSADPTENHQVPFFLMPTLGGSGTLRGYRTHRFRGEKAALVQAEYRWYASRRVELALFGDTGTVARLGEKLSVDHLKTNWGVGVRIRPVRGWVFRIDQAFSNEGYRALVRFSTSF